MEKRNNLITFLAAIIPGVGYMSLGLVKRGVQILALFLVIGPVCKLLGIEFVGTLIKVPIWFYAFFDTFNIAARIDKGETVSDSEFVFKKYGESGYGTNNGMISNPRNIWIIVAWVLIGGGILAIINQLFHDNSIYGLIKSYISMYLFPIILVFAGVYMLVKNKLS
jgi:TM2 domain-containing membrane protein YozV